MNCGVTDLLQCLHSFRLDKRFARFTEVTETTIILALDVQKVERTLKRLDESVQMKPKRVRFVVGVSHPVEKIVRFIESVMRSRNGAITFVAAQRGGQKF